MPGTRRLLIVVGIFVCAAALTGCEKPKPTTGQMWLVNESNSPIDAAVNAKLNQTVKKLDLDDIEFSTVVEFLRRASGINIYVKWRALKAVGVDKKTLVNVHLQNVTFRKVIRVVLDDISRVTELNYIADEGVLTISTKVDLGHIRVTRIYDVSDLIKPTKMDKTLLVPLLRKALHEPVRESDHEPSLFGSSNSDYDVPSTLADAYRGQIGILAEAVMWELQNRRLKNLIKAIQSVDPLSWKPNDQGSIRVFRNKLIIRQTRSGHRDIATILSTLRGKIPPFSNEAPYGRQATHMPAYLPFESAPAGPPKKVPPKEWPAGDKTKLAKPVNILGVDTSRIYVVFLLDCSGSMVDCRDDIVYSHILPALKNQSGEQYFNIICFRSASTPAFRGKLVAATEENKKKATAFLQKRYISVGPSLLLPALKKAYSVLDAANGSNSQAIFLITDGDFPDEHAKILKTVTSRHKHVKIPIHTLHYRYGSEVSTKLMKRLSEVTGGKYTPASME